MRWFAPEHFTAPAAKVDLRPGGHFLYCMRSPEGAEFWGKGVYREIVPPERLVYVDSFADEEGNPVTPEQYGLSPDYPAETLVTVTLADQGGKTLLTLRHAGLPSGRGQRHDRGRLAIPVGSAGRCSWERLAARPRGSVPGAHFGAPSGVSTVHRAGELDVPQYQALFNFEPQATAEEIHSAALQYVRKISGFNRPSKANEAAFNAAVDEIAAASARLLASLQSSAPARDRETEAAHAKERSARRFGSGRNNV